MTLEIVSLAEGPKIHTTENEKQLNSHNYSIKDSDSSDRSPANVESVCG